MTPEYNYYLDKQPTQEKDAPAFNTQTAVQDKSNLAESGNGTQLVNGTFESSNYKQGVAGFQLGSDGIIRALGAILSGAITATSGSIGNWDVVTNYIYSLVSGTPTSSPSDGVVLDASNNAIIIYENTEKRVELGFLSSGVFGIKVYDDDGASVLFEVSDTQKKIAGWTASQTTLANGTDIILDASNKKISINNATFGNAGIQLDFNGGTPRVYIGDGANQFFQFDGTNISWKGTNSELTAAGVLSASNVSITGGAMSATSIASIPNSTATDLSVLKFTHDITFSASDNDTVAWGTGTITFSNGRTFSIAAGNTGNMAAVNWIYLDPDTSTTVLQTTTTPTTAMGANKVPIAIAQNNSDTSANAVFTVKEGAAKTTLVAANIITSTLSAISADLGSITAGTVTGATIRTASSGTRFQMTSTAFQGIDASSNVVFEVIIDGANAGDVIIGDDATGNYIQWDNSAGTLSVFGTLIADSPSLYTLTAGETIAAGDALGLGYYVNDNDLVVDIDSYVDKDNPTTNYGTGTLLYTKNTASGSERLSFLQFDFTGLPTTNLTAATFYIKTGGSGTPAGTTTLKLVTSTWTEGGVTYNTAPTVGSSIGSFAPSVTSTFYSADITTAVQNWLSGATTNYGFRLESSSTNTIDYHSSEASTSTDRPYLVLQYNTGKVFKISAVNSTNTQRFLGFAYENISSDSTGRVQLSEIVTLSSLTANSIYYLSDTRGSIATSAGTVSKKVGIALSTTDLFIDKVT